uniref:Transmembrane protein n=2 Tax=Macrostomum lignano TaxID=282301 RepID=A0A1I8FIB9_9PLAT
DNKHSPIFGAQDLVENFSKSRTEVEVAQRLTPALKRPWVRFRASSASTVTSDGDAPHGQVQNSLALQHKYALPLLKTLGELNNPFRISRLSTTIILKPKREMPEIDQHQQPRYLAVSAAAVLTSLPFARRIHQNLPSLSINSKVAAAVAIAATAGGGLLIALLGRRLLNDCRRRRRLRAALNAKRAERRRAKAEFGAYLASQTMSDAEEARDSGPYSSPARRRTARRSRLGQDRVLLDYQRRAYPSGPEPDPLRGRVPASGPVRGAGRPARLKGLR